MAARFKAPVKAPAEALVRDHAALLAESLGLILWGVEVIPSGRTLVRVFVERPKMERSAEMEGPVEKDAPIASGGVDVDACAELSRRLGLALEVENVFAGSWTLEVSSPGLDRLFFHPDQLRGYIGREIDLVLSAPPAGLPEQKKLRGVLLAVRGDTLDLAPELAPDPAPGGTTALSLAWSQVRKARLIHVFAKPKKPGKSGKYPAMS
jgi:ribosome maturation factor RimP